MLLCNGSTKEITTLTYLPSRRKNAKKAKRVESFMHERSLYSTSVARPALSRQTWSAS